MKRVRELLWQKKLPTTLFDLGHKIKHFKFEVSDDLDLADEVGVGRGDGVLVQSFKALESLVIFHIGLVAFAVGTWLVVVALGSLGIRLFLPRAFSNLEQQRDTDEIVHKDVIEAADKGRFRGVPRRADQLHDLLERGT